MRPILRSVNQTMFNRVEMNIIDVAIHILLAADNMIPKPMLPDPSRYQPVSLSILGRETQLDSLQYNRNMRRPGVKNKMKMIGQDNPGRQFIRTPRVTCLKRILGDIDVRHQQRLPGIGHIGDKIDIAVLMIPAQFGHT